MFHAEHGFRAATSNDTGSARLRVRWRIRTGRGALPQEFRLPDGDGGDRGHVWSVRAVGDAVAAPCDHRATVAALAVHGMRMWSGARFRRLTGRTTVAAPEIGRRFTLKDGASVRAASTTLPHPTLGERRGLVHHQRPHPHVQRQPRDLVGEGEAAADVHARARLGVAAVEPQTYLDARPQRQPAAAEGEAPRALQRRAHTRPLQARRQRGTRAHLFNERGVGYRMAKPGDR